MSQRWSKSLGHVITQAQSRTASGSEFLLEKYSHIQVGRVLAPPTMVESVNCDWRNGEPSGTTHWVGNRLDSHTQSVWPIKSVAWWSNGDQWQVASLRSWCWGQHGNILVTLAVRLRAPSANCRWHRAVWEGGMHWRVWMLSLRRGGIVTGSRG